MTAAARSSAAFATRLAANAPQLTALPPVPSSSPSSAQRGEGPRGEAPHTPAAEWIELRLVVDPADAETVADLLRSVAPDGVAIEPAIRPLDGAEFSYELTPAPTVLRASVRAPFPPRARRALRARLRTLPLAAPPGRLRYTPVRADAYADAWRCFYRTQHIGMRLVVRPTWEPYAARPGEVVLQLDPGAAFGTGQHETTRLCLAALDAHMAPGDDAIDVGSGSGILAVAAALLGARRVQAVDIDPTTVAVATANAALNGVAERVAVAAGSLGAAWPWPRPASADVVVVNISALALGDLLPAAAAALRPGGRLIGSGYLESAASSI
ncbi:MAG: methyltransferase domain-containing protein, partial [Chloroflexi bacterium]|nr:methyltransferase domain-containing protein [Chloroflexota bacterium]